MLQTNLISELHTMQYSTNVHSIHSKIILHPARSNTTLYNTLLHFYIYKLYKCR